MKRLFSGLTTLAIHVFVLYVLCTYGSASLLTIAGHHDLARQYVHVMTVEVPRMIREQIAFLQLNATAKAASIDGEVLGSIRFDDRVGMIATVTIGDQTVETDEYGFFKMKLEPGEYTYHVSTLLGDVSGEVKLEPGDSLKIVFPASDTWDDDAFREIAFQGFNSDRSSREMIRWPLGSEIKVWIEPTEDKPMIGNGHDELAWQIILEWEKMLDHAIAFTRVDDRDEASFVWLWSDEDLPYVGLCATTTVNGMIFWAEVSIVLKHLQRYNSRGLEALYHHEVGHCLALDHSSNPEHVMYRKTTQNLGPDIVTDDERMYARLIYSIRPGITEEEWVNGKL